MSRRTRNYVIYGIIIVAIIAIVVAFFRPSSDSKTQVPISTFIVDAKEGHVSRVEVQGNSVNVVLKGGGSYVTRKEDNVSVVTLLTDAGADPGAMEINVKRASTGGALGLILAFLPLLVIIILVVWATNKFAHRR